MLAVDVESDALWLALHTPVSLFIVDFLTSLILSHTYDLFITSAARITINRHPQFDLHAIGISMISISNIHNMLQWVDSGHDCSSDFNH